MAIFNFSYIVNFVEDAVQLLSKGVNFVPYRLVWPEFIIPANEPVQKHPWFVSLKIPVLNELYWTYRRISDILAEKWIPGSTKNLKKMEKASSRKLMMSSLLVVFPCYRPFPQPSSFCFIRPLLFYFLFSSSSSSVLTETILLVPSVLVVCVALVFSFFFFFFWRISVWLLFNCFVWVLTPHENSNEFKFQIYLTFRLAATHIWYAILFFYFLILPLSHFFCPVWKVKIFKGTSFIVLSTF